MSNDKQKQLVQKAAGQINVRYDAALRILADEERGDVGVDKGQFFYCYDFLMQDHLSSDGHKYITHARSIKTGKEFWLFPKSESLQTSIDTFIGKKNHVKNNI